MKALLIRVGFFSAALTTATWAAPAFTESISSREYSDEDALPADVYLRLSDRRCGNCTLIVRDLIEAGVIGNTIGAVKNTLNDDLTYTFRLTLLTACNPCYRAVHFWEMNILNRPAKNEEVHYWLASEEAKPLVEYFSKL